jgi:hypothetical protein
MVTVMGRVEKKVKKAMVARMSLLVLVGWKWEWK